MLLVWVFIVLEHAKSSILPNGNFREFFLWRGGILRFQNWNSRWPWSRSSISFRNIIMYVFVIGSRPGLSVYSVRGWSGRPSIKRQSCCRSRCRCYAVDLWSEQSQVRHQCQCQCQSWIYIAHKRKASNAISGRRVQSLVVAWRIQYIYDQKKMKLKVDK